MKFRALVVAAVILGAAGVGAGAACGADASEITLHVGPPQIGSGGANPISIPPTNPVEYELEYCASNDIEGSLALTPGILVVGKRARTAMGVYASLGGGAIYDANGAGPGLYSAIGYTGAGTFAFNAELKQAIGYDTEKKKVLSPYAIRVGLSIVFH